MTVELASGFAVVGAGAWLFGRAQPAAVRGTMRSRGLKGFVCPDRGVLSRGELAGDLSHAKSAEFEEKKPHAESAEFKSHAENAESAETMRSNGLESPLRGIDPSGEAASKNTQDGAPRSLRSLRDNQNPEAGDSHGARAWCSSSACPFLTRIDCGVPVSAVSDKVLVAPAAARTGARLVKVVPLSFARSIRTTIFSRPDERAQGAPRTPAQPASNAAEGGLERGEAVSNGGEAAWVVMATRSRTTRIALADGESLGVRPDAAVAWTGARPTGFCPRLRLLDVLLPRGPRDLMLHFHGPAIVWIEGSEPLPLRRGVPGKAVF